MKQWLRWLPFAIVLVEVALWLTGVLTLGQAVILFVALEILLAVVVLGEFVALSRAYRLARRSAATRPAAAVAALDAVLPGPVAYLVKQEFRVLGAIVGALWRRRAVGPADHVLAYGGQLRVLLAGMVGVSIIEVVVVELVVPWVWLRWLLVVIGGYGLVWVCGFACSLYTRPHRVSRTELVLRFAVFTEVTIPLTNVASVGQSLRGTHKRLLEIGEGELSMSVLGSTNVSVRLDPPTEVRAGRAGPRAIERLNFYVDQPDLAAALLRELTAAGGEGTVTGSGSSRRAE